MPTISELVDQIRDMLDEPSAAQWSDQMLRRWINEANRDIARITRHYKANDTISTVAGQAEYSLPPEIIAVEQAWYDDGARVVPLTPRHIENMDQVWGYRQDFQAPYPTFYMVLGHAPTHVIRVYPIPAYSLHSIKLLSAVLPAEIPLTGSDTADVEIPPAWYDLLRDYVCAKALQRDRDPRWEEFYRLYIVNRDTMAVHSDYTTANREIIPDPERGYLPRWLVEPEGW